MSWVILVLFIAAVGAGAWKKYQAETQGRANPSATGTPEQRHAFRDLQIVCPHCQTKGGVHTQHVSKRQRLSLGKTAGAVMTLGASTPITGLSKRQGMTEMSCANCGVKWNVA